MRYCFQLQVRPDRMAEYVARHQAVGAGVAGRLGAPRGRHH
jgi:L-rhamnose mutarotase